MGNDTQANAAAKHSKPAEAKSVDAGENRAEWPRWIAAHVAVAEQKCRGDNCDPNAPLRLDGIEEDAAKDDLLEQRVEDGEQNADDDHAAKRGDGKKTAVGTNVGVREEMERNEHCTGTNGNDDRGNDGGRGDAAKTPRTEGGSQRRHDCNECGVGCKRHDPKPRPHTKYGNECGGTDKRD